MSWLLDVKEEAPAIALLTRNLSGLKSWPNDKAGRWWAGKIDQVR